MSEEETRALVREEIRAAFGKLSESADYYTEGFGELTSSAAHMLKVAADMTFKSLKPADPEPVNPFAPKRTPQEWADGIRAMIRDAEADGSSVWISGHSETGPRELVVGTGDNGYVAFTEIDG